MVGRGLGLFAFEVVRIRRAVTLDNLAHAFPEWSPRERLQVARDCYRHFGVTFLELCCFPGLTPSQIADRVRLENTRPFDLARAEGRGAVLLTGHVGNWELLGAAAAAAGYPFWVLVRRQSNPRVDAYVTQARESAGMRVLPADESLLPVWRALHRNEFVAFLSDQDAGRHGIFVPFFGRPASTPLGPIRFARRSGSPIVVGFALRRKDGRYRSEFFDPIHVRDDLPPEEAEREATERTVAQLEAVVRQYPEQWFWMHRRWKTKPRDAARAPEEGSSPAPLAGGRKPDQRRGSS